MVAGAVLIVAALLLFLYNQNLNREAGEAVEEVMPELIEAAEEAAEKEQEDGQEEETAEDEAAAEEETETAAEEAEDEESVEDPEAEEAAEEEEDTEEEMTAVTVDSYEYIGYLTIPSLDLELSVMSSWSYPKLKISPCRYSGSIAGGNLVICAHNYSRHFGRIKNLSEGDDVYFTDMDGNTYHYEVAEVTTLAPTAIEEMTSSGYDLTLFTCTYGGKSRVTVRCSLVN